MRLLAALAVFAAVLVSGCGNGTGPPTATIAEGTTVDADRYLADSAAAAAAIRAFNAELAGVGSPATAPRLKAVAPRLAPPLESARLLAERLRASRLEDRRLEAQRSREAGSLALAVVAMERVESAAQAGDPARTKAAAEELANAVAALRGGESPAP